MLHDIHAQFAQALISTLLEYACYRVLRLGAEDLISEVKSLQTGRGAHLRLPARLAALPDLLVIDQDGLDSVMLEVKFRKTIDEENARNLHGALTHLNGHWPEALAVIVTAQPPIANPVRYQDHIRIVRSNDLNGFGASKPIEERWKALPTLGAIFRRVHDAPGFHADADKAVEGLRLWTNSWGIRPVAMAADETTPRTS